MWWTTAQIHSGQKCLPWVACLWSKIPMFQRAGMNEGGLPPYEELATCTDIFSGLKITSPFLGCLFFNGFMKWNWRPLSLKSCNFEGSKDIMTKFKSQALHIIKIKYWNAGRSGNPPSSIPALWNIGILLHKQALLGKHYEPECTK